MTIKQAQQRLQALGFSLPRFGPDGDWGAETHAAFLKAMDELERLRGPVTGIPVSHDPFLNAAAFAKWAPKAVPGTLAALEAAAQSNGPLREVSVLQSWLGQMYVESSGYSVLVENLNYSVEGLLKTFSRARISEAEARRYGRAPGQAANQEAIANTVYGGEWGRKNLGNTQPGDGWRFRGSGVKQITGRYNTERSGFTPEELRTDIHKSVKASADFFIKHGCVEPARRGDVVAVTKIINGGTNGLEDRKARTAQAAAIII